MKRSKKHANWQILLGTTLIALSALFYFIHYAIFKDAHHIFIYLLGDIAFVPIEVLLVTLIIHRLLSNREKRSMLEKMNMVIGVFFSEVGTNLLKCFAEFDPETDSITKDLVVKSEWSNKEFTKMSKRFRKREYKIDSRRGDLEALRNFLLGKRDFMLRLLENPNLLEHDSFTELLWAVTHFAEELNFRQDIKRLTDTDAEHLSGDMIRVYGLLISEWLDYMKHLNSAYPYLFSLAIRTNPFDVEARVEVG
jgi:hypothetical protein